MTQSDILISSYFEKQQKVIFEIHSFGTNLYSLARCFKSSCRVTSALFLCFRDDDDKLPPSAVANGATLRFQSKTTDNEGLYYCTASNTHGSMRGALFMDVIPGEVMFESTVDFLCLFLFVFFGFLLWLSFDSVVTFL